MKKPSILIWGFIILGVLGACSGGSGGSSSGGGVYLTINSVGINTNNDRSPALRAPFFPADPTPDDFSVTPNWMPRYISANAPEYLKITIIQIEVQASDDRWINVWDGEEELTISGSSVDMNDVNGAMTPLDPLYVKNIRVTFNSFGKVRGSVSDNFITDPLAPYTGEAVTYYTRDGYFYNAVTRTGGASSDAVFRTGPAEEIEISLAGDKDTFSMTYAVERDIEEGDAPTFNLLFDLNMVLRFYNGKRDDGWGQPNPPDPEDKAFFFAHSITVDNSSFIGGFFGEIGSIDGYKTYSVQYLPGSEGNNAAGTGWMTLVYDADGNFVAGQMFGDDDNGISAGKGRIGNYEQNGSTVDISDDLLGVTIYGFQRLTSIDSTTPLLAYDPPSNFEGYKGEVILKLKLQE